MIRASPAGRRTRAPRGPRAPCPACDGGRPTSRRRRTNRRRTAGASASATRTSPSRPSSASRSADELDGRVGQVDGGEARPGAREPDGVGADARSRPRARRGPGHPRTRRTRGRTARVRSFACSTSAKYACDPRASPRSRRRRADLPVARTISFDSPKAANRTSFREPGPANRAFLPPMPGRACLRRRRPAELHEGRARSSRPCGDRTGHRAAADPHRPALRRRDEGRLPRRARAPGSATSSSTSARASHGEQTARALVGVERVLRRARAVTRRRRRRRQLDPRRRARRGEARDPRLPPRGRPAELRPDDARGAQPQAHRPPLDAPPRPTRQSANDNLAAEGIPPTGVAPRREHDDRHAARARRGGAGAAMPGRRSGSTPADVRARDAAPAGARRRPGAPRRDRPRARRALASAPLVFPAHPRTAARLAAARAPRRRSSARVVVLAGRSAIATSSRSRRRRGSC